MFPADTFKVTTPSDREIKITRLFDAPRPLVYDTMNKPELLKRWLHGPPGWTMTSIEDEQRVGGGFRWAWRGPNGEEMAMRGVYLELKPPERVVRTESFEFGCAPQMGEQVGTLVLTEQGNKTHLSITLLYPSKEARDATVASGMEHGMAAGYVRLDELLAGMA